MFASLDKAFSAEENDTKIIKTWLNLMSEELCRGKAFHYGVLWKAFPQHNSSLIGRKNQDKFENDCISRCGHRLKITPPNLMILVSISSVEDALFYDINEYDIFSSQGTENPPFRFFGTPGRAVKR